MTPSPESFFLKSIQKIFSRRPPEFGHAKHNAYLCFVKAKTLRALTINHKPLKTIDYELLQENLQREIRRLLPQRERAQTKGSVSTRSLVPTGIEPGSGDDGSFG